jgi:hypothetical protein
MDDVEFCPTSKEWDHGHLFRGPALHLGGVLVRRCEECDASQVILQGGLHAFLEALEAHLMREQDREFVDGMAVGAARLLKGIVSTGT